MANYYNTKPASSLKRLINFVFDSLIIIVIAYLIKHFVFPKPITQLDSGISFNLSFYLFFLLFYISMEYFLGKTIGKMITRTKMISRSGKKINLMNIIIRTFLRFFILEWISFFKKRPIGWHDSLSDTKVIDLKS